MRLGVATLGPRVNPVERYPRFGNKLLANRVGWFLQGQKGVTGPKASPGCNVYGSK